MIKLTGRIRSPRLAGSINLVPAEGGGGPLQAKTAYPSHSEQIIAPDEDYYGLVAVTVKPVPRLPACVVRVAEGIVETVEIAKISLSASVSSELPEHIACEYEVLPVDGAYGFTLNSAGYWESQNKGVKSSYAMCKIAFTTAEPGYVVLNCINYAEANYDYGLISGVDVMLSMSNDVDSGAFSFYGKNSAEVQPVMIVLPAGESFVCVKYRKDVSGDSNNDSLQFIVAPNPE